MACEVRCKRAHEWGSPEILRERSRLDLNSITHFFLLDRFCRIWVDLDTFHMKRFF